jgi:hypothetical protein
MALITVEELEAFMGREFTEAEELQAAALIEAVSAVIEIETGVSFELVEDEEIRIQADGYGMIELNAKPISAVTVYDLEDPANEQECAVWDGLATVYGLYPNQVVDIVYSHGYSSVPGDIKAVAYGVTSRIMYNPGGLRQETVGAISVTYPGIGGEAGTINFSALEKKVLGKYRIQAKSMRLAAQRRRIGYLPELTVYNDID